MSPGRRRWALFALVAAPLACGGGGGPGHVELSGKTPSEGAALAAKAVCTREARCGHPSILCSGGGAAGGGGSDAGPAPQTCTATIRPLAYGDCFDDANGDLAELLACPALTPADVDMLERCIDALAGKACVTQAEADAQARMLEMGGDAAPEDAPPECAVLLTPPAGCAGPPPPR